MNKNTHARTKQKRKKLRLKNFLKRVFDKRQQKKIEALKPKGKTVYGDAINVAIPVDAHYNRYNTFDRNLNQRQRRKRARQSGIYK